MSTMTCQHCTAATEGQVLCKRCQRTLGVALTNIAAYHEDLPGLGRDRARVRVSGHAASTLDDQVSERTAPTFDERREDALAETRNVLSTWCRVLVDDRPQVSLPADSVDAMARLLRQQVRTIATLGWAGQITAEILDLEGRLLHLVQRGQGLWEAGVCGWDGESYNPQAETACRRRLYAVAGSDRVHCRACDTWWSVSERRAYLIEQARDQMLPVSVIARTVVGLMEGEPSVERLAKRISNWAERGQLDHYGVRARPEWGNRPLRVYRLGDVLDTLTRSAGRT